jgi:hypothetical protein
MRKLVLILITFLAVITFIQALSLRTTADNRAVLPRGAVESSETD